MEVEEINNNIQELLDEISSSLKRYNTQPSDPLLTTIKNKIEEVKREHRSFKAEIRELPRSERGPYDRKSRIHTETLQKLINQVKLAEQTSDRTQLLGEGGPSRPDYEVLSTGQVLDSAVKEQDESLKAVSRINQTATRGIETGTETLGVLDEQTEQLSRIREGVDDIEENLKTADRQIRVIVRRLGTDRCIQMMLCIVVLAFILLIILKAGQAAKGWFVEDSTTNTD